MSEEKGTREGDEGRGRGKGAKGIETTNREGGRKGLTENLHKKGK